MGGVLTILVIVGCVGLILFVLVQNPKGGGLNSEFGSAVQLGGAKRATDILEKGTWGLAIGIALICLIMVKPAGNSGATEDLDSDANADVENVDPNIPGNGTPGEGFNPSPNQPN
ncbi:MAG: preprotein translocase subunit SecG [Crocinitomicaceae bacterium]|nr:preprotein translocase subunit SecG [Crocinitomicaceae bacterium]